MKCRTCCEYFTEDDAAPGTIDRRPSDSIVDLSTCICLDCAYVAAAIELAKNYVFEAGDREKEQRLRQKFVHLHELTNKASRTANR